MQEKIQEVLEKLGKHRTSISLTYKDAYGWIVECRINRYKNISVVAFSKTETDALNSALELLDNLTKIQETINVPVPELSKQPYENGYCSATVENKKFTYKRINNILYLCEISNILNNEFIKLNKPFYIDDSYKFIAHTQDGDLYEYNNMGVMCGSAGLVLVKDNFAIAYKTIAIS